MALRPLLLAWHPAHLHPTSLGPSVLQATDVVPLNQSAWQTAVEAGARVIARPWEYVDQALIASVRSLARQSLESWQAHAGQFANHHSFPEGTEQLDAARVWMAYRDWHYSRALLERLDPLLRKAPRWHVPLPGPKLFTSWYGGNDIPAWAVQSLPGHREIEWIPNPHRGTPSKETSHSAPLSLPTKEWHLVNLLGLTDPLHHVERVLGRTSDVVVAHDQELSGCFDLFQSWSTREPRIRCLQLPAAESAGGETGGTFLALDASGKDPIGDAAIRELWPRHALLKRELDALVSRNGLPRSILVSDHASPEGLLILGLARQHGIPGESIAHSSRVLDPPFGMMPPDTSKWTYFASTRTDGTLARRLLPEGRARIRVRPSPRFRIGPRRVIRMARRLLAPAPATLRVGIVVTSGEAPLAPDFPISELLAQVRNLCSEPGMLKRRVQLVFRLRELEDSDRLFTEAIEGGDLPAVILRGTVENRLGFYRACDLLIELGSPGTAALESIADGTPVLRLCTGVLGGTDALRCAVHVVGKPASPWAGDLAFFCNNSLARRRLALRQFLALAGQTLEFS